MRNVGPCPPPHTRAPPPNKFHARAELSFRRAAMGRFFFLALLLTLKGWLRAWAVEADVLNSTAHSFPCKDQGQVLLYLRCDGKPDCADGSDEASCGTENVSCAPGEQQCGSGGPCLPLEQFCDDYPDCPDSSDESAKSCGSQATLPQTALPSLACSKEEFQCVPGASCFPLEWWCDGHPDCVDEQDEQNCGLDLPEPSVAAETGGKRVPAKMPLWILENPIYLAAISIVSLLIVTAAVVSVILLEQKRAKQKSRSYRPADRLTV